MAAVNHFHDKELTLQTHTGDTDWFDASCVVLGSALLANTEYLIIARGGLGGSINSNRVGMRVETADDAAIASKSEFTIEPRNNDNTQGNPFFFVHSFGTDSTPADVRIQMKTFSDSETVGADQMSLSIIDLDDLGSANYFETVHADDSVEYPTTQAAEFTIAGSNLGTDEWLVLAYQRTETGSSANNFRVEAHSALDAASSAVVGRDENEGEWTLAKAMSGFQVRHKASSGTPDFEIQTFEDDAAANMLNRGGYAIAIRASEFPDIQFAYTAGGTSIDSTERTMQTIASYSPTTTADHLLFGSLSQDGVNAGNTTQLHIEDDTVEMRVGDQPYVMSGIYDNTAEPLFNLFHQDNILSSDTSTYTLRGATDFGNTAEFRWLILWSLELAGAGGVVSLAGSGANASDGVGTLHRNRLALSGDGPNTSDGWGLLGKLIPVLGSGATASDGKGTLTPVRGISGSGPNTSDGRGDVDLTRGLVGSGPSSSDGVGTLHRNRLALTGSGPNASDGRGDLTVTAGGVVSLSGSGASASDGRGNLGFRHSLVGSGATASDGRGTVDLTLDLVGSGPATSDGQGTAKITRGLVGSGANAGDGRGDAALTRGLSGSGPSTTDGRGIADLTRGLVGSGASASDGRGVLTLVIVGSRFDIGVPSASARDDFGMTAASGRTDAGRTTASSRTS